MPGGGFQPGSNPVGCGCGCGDHSCGCCGPQGIRGPEGPAGATGAQGPRGIQGTQGPDGVTGPTGLTGPQGDKGDTGTSLVVRGVVVDKDDLPPSGNAAGDAWVTEQNPRGHVFFWDGAHWIDGGPMRGPQGPQGKQGIQGVQGYQGTSGLQGSQGEQGIQGIRGPQGAQGPRGGCGPPGVGVCLKGSVPTQADLPEGCNAVSDAWIVSSTGHLWFWNGCAWVDLGLIRGPQGPIGPQGPTGIQGPAGPSGPQGMMGLRGQQGVKGPEGPGGPPGAGISLRGSVETAADLPSSGNEIGDAYFNEDDHEVWIWDGDDWFVVPLLEGLQGPRGPEGPEGPPGIQGVRGPEGPYGLRGPQGIAGPGGPIGPPGPAGAGVCIKGVIDDPADLPLDPCNRACDAFLDPNGHVWVWDGQQWVDVGKLQGPVGPQGIQGPPGQQGIQGPEGPQGAQGAQGPRGPEGPEGEEGAEGPQGPAGVGINIRGEVDTYDDLPAGPHEPGDAWITQDTGHWWIWTEEGWIDGGHIVGPQGPRGPRGYQGPVGPQGPQGLRGATGPPGQKGDPGDLSLLVAGTCITLAQGPGVPPTVTVNANVACIQTPWLGDLDAACNGVENLASITGCNGELEITGNTTINGDLNVIGNYYQNGEPFEPGGAQVIVSETPPENPQSGWLWWDPVSTQLFIWYEDPETSQWVVVTNQGGVAGEGGGDKQTPWKQHIDAAGYDLISVGCLRVGSHAFEGAPGDLSVSRENNPGVGAIYWGSAGTGYINFDGSAFIISRLTGIGGYPAYMLDVAGDVNCTGQYRVNGAPVGQPAGANQSIQFNNNGAFDASSNLTWDGVSATLGVGGAITASALTVNGNVAFGAYFRWDTATIRLGVGNIASSPVAQIDTGNLGAPIKIATYGDGRFPGFSYGIGQGTDSLTFGVGINAQTGTPQMVLKGTGSAQQPAKLGINTTTPAYEVDVVGDVNCTGQYRINGTPVNLAQLQERIAALESRMA